MKTAVCLITKAFLLEDIEFWINHYLNYCGFDHIFLYDNESHCGSLKQLLKPTEQVTIEEFTDEYKLTKLHLQQDIYEDVYMKIRKEYDWLMCVDDDEYLWLNKDKYKNVKEFLTDMYSQGKKQICIPWQMMSYEDTNIPLKRTRPAPLECMYTYYTFFRHKTQQIHIKSIVNCKELHIRSCNNHCWANAEGNAYLDYQDIPIGNVYIFGADVDLSKCNAKIMHYRRRSYEEWEFRINNHNIDMPQEEYRLHLNQFDEGEKMPKGYTVFYDPFNLDE